MENAEGGPRIVNGYIVLNKNNKHLISNGRGLMSHDHLAEAYVYTREQLDEIMEQAEREKWEFRPTHIIPATWQEGVGTVLPEAKIDKINKLRIEIGKLPPLKK